MTARSASSTRRWLACGLSVRLPQDKGQEHPSAAVGTRFHALVEAALVARKWVELDPMDAHFELPLRETLKWFDAKASGAADFMTEQAYELKPLAGYATTPGQREPRWNDRASCRVLPKTGQHRDYPNAHGCIYGTADAVIIHKGAVHVIDWKTGQKSEDHDSQLLTLALMASMVVGVEHVTASAVYINLQTGKVREHTRVLDSFDLSIHAGAITRASIVYEQNQLPDPVPGKYCFFCPAVGCPEKLRAR
ncbi:MAG: DUF2800 domain-containing protein [Ilumatobacteraceae bacterium]